MKSTRKKLIEGKKEKNRLVLGLSVLGVLTVLSFLGLREQIPFSKVTFLTDTKLQKPIGSSTIQEKLITLLSQKEIEATKMKIDESKIEVTLNNGVVAIFNDKDIEKQVASLQLLIERFKIEGRKVKVIDLRFSKPVIR